MMRNYTRFIPGEEIGDVAPWDFSAVDPSVLLAGAQLEATQATLAMERDDVLRQEGYSQGYAAGYAQAQAQGILDAQRQIDAFIASQGNEAAQHFAKLFETAQARLAEAEQVMAQGVLELSCELARQVVRQELSINPNALQPVVREALGILVSDGKSALVRLNPLDMEVFQDVMRDEFPGLALTLVADASVTRGGCTVEAAGSVVNGRLETRWLRAVANLGLSVPWEVHPDD